MLPLRDINPRRLFPAVNLTLIAINILFFAWELSLGRNLEPELTRIAFVPARFWIPGFYLADALAIFVSMFLHGGLLHIGGNMLYLWIFGDNVEDRMGHGRYLVFYLTCGAIATLSHAFINPDSPLPSIGASGAIAGVLGAYLVLFPHARVVTLIPLGFLIFLRELPALFVLGLWFVFQLFIGTASLGVSDSVQRGGVAYFAHIGGFVAGMILVFLFARPRRRQSAPPPW